MFFCRVPSPKPGASPLEVHLTRQKFEQLTNDLFDRCRLPLERACWQAGVDLVAASDQAAASRRKGGTPQACLQGHVCLGTDAALLRAHVYA
jgi:hypothetical protein